MTRRHFTLFSARNKQKGFNIAFDRLFCLKIVISNRRKIYYIYYFNIIYYIIFSIFHVSYTPLDLADLSRETQ